MQHPVSITNHKPRCRLLQMQHLHLLAGSRRVFKSVNFTDLTDLEFADAIIEAGFEWDTVSHLTDDEVADAFIEAGGLLLSHTTILVMV